VRTVIESTAAIRYLAGGSITQDVIHRTHTKAMNSSQATTLITGGTVLTPEGLMPDYELLISGDRIASLGKGLGPADHHIDATGTLVLPGIVDLHGDAFERDCSPRPGVSFPLPMAVAANDASLIANGITSSFYAVSDSFEPGIRSREYVRDVINYVRRHRTKLKCDTRIHLRHEIVAIDGHAELVSWIRSKQVDLLSFSDHLPDTNDPHKTERYLRSIQRRVFLSDSEGRALIASLAHRRALGEAQADELAAIARSVGLPLASHDDDSEASLATSIARGVCISEFPTTSTIAAGARDGGATVIYGAPNVVRGGSHVGAVDVTEAIRAGVVDALCSDYYYPALLAAPFALAGERVLDLPAAWKLVSEAPARAAGLLDRGRLASGARADVLLLEDDEHTALGVTLVMSGGCIRYAVPSRLQRSSTPLSTAPSLRHSL